MNAPPIRVALVAPSLRGGGLERLVRDLALGVDPHSFEVRVYCVSGLGVYAADLEAAGIPAIDCTEPKRLLRGIPFRLLHALRAFTPHVVHAHSGTWYPSAVAHAWLRSFALMYTEHGRYPPEPRSRALIERWCAAHTAGLFAVSTKTAEYLRDFLRLRETPGVLANGVDLHLFQPGTAADRERVRLEWGYRPDQVVAIAVGRFVPVKNQAAIVRATAAVLRDHPDFRLVFVGTGPLEPDVRALTAELGIEHAVRFDGFRADVAARLGAADLFVNASTTEGLPVSIIESMAVGLGVVATDVGGTADVLGDPPAGILVPSGDPDALTRALATLAGDAHLRRDFAGRALAQSHRYSLDLFLQRHMELYRSFAGR